MALMLDLSGGFLLALFFSTLISSVCADYYIDDTNNTLTYTSGPKVVWGPFSATGETLELLLPNGSYQIINPYFCYDYTYRYAACSSADSCVLTIPFTGSGITVYVYQAGPVGINATITVDGANPQTNVLNAPPAPNYEIANVSMFNVQHLPSGPHSLNMLVNDMLGSFSGMMFDYAYVNETLVTNPVTTTSVSQTSTSSAAASSSPISAVSSGSKTNVGAIAGGVIGGIAVLVLGALAFWWIHRQKQSSEMIDLHSDTPLVPYNPHDLPRRFNTSTTSEPFIPYNNSTIISDRSDLSPARSMEFSSFSPLIPNRSSTYDASSPTTPTVTVTRRDTIPFTATTTSEGSTDRKTRLVLSNDTPSSPSGVPQSSRSLAHGMLTDEQADFINSLHQNNVPAAAIAQVMESMLADRNSGVREWERVTRSAWSNTMTAPPSYEQVGSRH